MQKIHWLITKPIWSFGQQKSLGRHLIDTVHSAVSDQLRRDSVYWVGAIITVKKATCIAGQFTQSRNKGTLELKGVLVIIQRKFFIVNFLIDINSDIIVKIPSHCETNFAK